MTTNIEEMMQTDEGKAYESKLTEGLRTTLGNLKGEKAELESKLSNLKEQLSAKSEPEPTEKVDSDTQAKFDAYEAKVKAAETTSKQLQKRMLNNQTASNINDVILANGGNPELLGIHVRMRTVSEMGDDGNIVIKALTEDGKPMYDKDGNPAGINDVVDSLKSSDIFKPAFRANLKSGSGDHGQSKASGPINFLNASKEQLNNKQVLESALFK